MDKNSSVLLAAVIIFLVVVAFGGIGSVESILYYKAKPASDMGTAADQSSGASVIADNAQASFLPETQSPGAVPVQMQPPEPLEPAMQTVKNLHPVE